VDAGRQGGALHFKPRGKIPIYKQAVGQGTPELLDTGADVPNILRLKPDRTKVLYSALRDHGANEEPMQHDAKMEAKLAGKDSGSSMPSAGQNLMVFSDHASAIERRRRATRAGMA